MAKHQDITFLVSNSTSSSMFLKRSFLITGFFKHFFLNPFGNSKGYLCLE